MTWLDGIVDAMDMNLGKLWEMVRNREDWDAAVTELQRVRRDLTTEKQAINLRKFFLSCKKIFS